MKQLALDLSAAPAPTLENFVAGRNGELAQRLRGIAAGTAEERFVYLWGAAGCGRSHLLKATVAALCGNGVQAAYVACAPGTALPGGLERMQCVALDDVERLEPDGQVAAFHLYNALRERRCALLAAGAAPPVQLPLREDLLTRLAWGLVYQVHALSDEEKARALAEQAARRGFRLAPEVCAFLLARGRRDMPSLTALLDAIDRRSLETGRPVTVPLVKDVLEAEKIPPGPPLERGGASGGAGEFE